MAEFPPCPKCGGNHFEVWRYPHRVVLHWIWNPGLIVKIGQRVPRVTLFCQTCDVAAIERSYIPCPSCNTLNSGNAWKRRDSFGHWLGLVCPNCGNRIPCLRNAFSVVLLAVTIPLWYLPCRLYFRDRPVARPTGDTERPPVTDRTWAAGAVLWGLFMWLLMSVAPAVWKWHQGQPFPWSYVLIGLVMWSIGGAAFGRTMKRRLGSKPQTGTNDS